MSDPLTVTKTIYKAFQQGDIATILDQMSERVSWESWADNSAQRVGVPWLLPRRGKAGVAEFFRYLGTKMQVREFHVLSMMAGGNQVAVEFVIDVAVSTTGRHYRDEEIHLWTFDPSGKVTRLRHYADTAKHIWAAGLDS